jgi:2-dehydro-3-deoxyphosphogluconate aldolase/(4S)-4-hydroxy-2-oxoglutarate aldolase
MNMNKDEVAKRIRAVGIVPVVRATSAKLAQMAADAVCAGGIPIVEVTMTVPGAIELIAQLAKSIGDEVLIGAGTVLDAQTAAKCLDAGAQFVISPGFDPGTVDFVSKRGVLMMAGALTPTEVIDAWRAGSDFVKIFPCGSMGGAKYIKALKAPLPQIPMVPTGGVNLETAADLIRAGAEALGIGGELVSAAALAAGDTKPITEAARKYVAIVQETRNELTLKVSP